MLLDLWTQSFMTFLDMSYATSFVRWHTTNPKKKALGSKWMLMYVTSSEDARLMYKQTQSA